MPFFEKGDLVTILFLNGPSSVGEMRYIWIIQFCIVLWLCPYGISNLTWWTSCWFVAATCLLLQLTFFLGDLEQESWSFVKLLFCSLLWEIWLGRHTKVFEDKFEDINFFWDRFLVAGIVQPCSAPPLDSRFSESRLKSWLTRDPREGETQIQRRRDHSQSTIGLNSQKKNRSGSQICVQGQSQARAKIYLPKNFSELRNISNFKQSKKKQIYFPKKTKPSQIRIIEHQPRRVVVEFGWNQVFLSSQNFHLFPSKRP